MILYHACPEFRTIEMNFYARLHGTHEWIQQCDVHDIKFIFDYLKSPLGDAVGTKFQGDIIHHKGMLELFGKVPSNPRLDKLCQYHYHQIIELMEANFNYTSLPEYDSYTGVFSGLNTRDHVEYKIERTYEMDSTIYRFVFFISRLDHVASRKMAVSFMNLFNEFEEYADFNATIGADLTTGITKLREMAIEQNIDPQPYYSVLVSNESFKTFMEQVDIDKWIPLFRNKKHKSAFLITNDMNEAVMAKLTLGKVLRLDERITGFTKTNYTNKVFWWMDTKNPTKINKEYCDY